jgi:hypothetical protein
LKYAKITAKTNRLSTDRLFSSSHAVVYSVPAVVPRTRKTTAPKIRARLTHRPLQAAASLKPMTCAVRWDSRSTASDTTTVAANAPHSQSGTSSTPNTLTTAHAKYAGPIQECPALRPWGHAERVRPAGGTNLQETGDDGRALWVEFDATQTRRDAGGEHPAA